MADENLNDGKDGASASAVDDAATRSPGGLRPEIEDRKSQIENPNGKKRWGKVANLPAEVRDWVSSAMRDGKKYEEILTELRRKQILGLNRYDLSNWRRRGGYQEWLREEQRAALLRERTNQVLNVAQSLDEDGRIGFEKVSASIVAARVLDCLQNFDPAHLDNLLATKPQMFFRLAKTVNDQSLDLSRLRKVELDFRKYRDNAEEQKRRIEAALKPAPKAEGLTKEQIAEISEAMRML